MTSLDSSYAWCRSVAKSRAKNFYYSFLLLDRPRRDAMCAVYAFMRICDDLSDEPGEKSAAVFQEWRNDMLSALHGVMPDHHVWPAFADTARRYGIPEQYFNEMIDGVESDIDFRTIDTFDDLYRYCYRVASVVGLTVIHILGFRSPEALPLAEKCGVAFQLTNILRDVKEDAENGRVYLPTVDMQRFGVSRAELSGDRVSPNLRRLLEFESERAQLLYRESAPLVAMVDPSGQPMLSALIETYSALHTKIKAAEYEVLASRISLPTVQKLWILAKSRLARRP